MTDLVIIVPMLGRAHHVDPLLDSINRTCEARVIFVCSPGDAEVLERVSGEGTILVNGPYPGDYARKINAGIETSTEPLVFLGASDLRFHEGWFEAAKSRLAPGVGVVGTNDLGSRRVMRGDHSTHSLVTREYVERFGTIDEPGKALHDGYHHEFVDDELVATAKFRGAWAFAEDSIVEHLHPNWGKAPSDDIYDRQAERMRLSRPLFLERSKLWT